ncbi:tRNA dihydrouridine synthase DusB, partial [candidate division GN15 bacterium]|nr:tRNA dihydrouridine synthase DusB [candidate division GN15 bacterium]
MRLGNLNLASPLVLAPLAGVSNRPFRLLARRYGASLVYTEMVSSEGIVRHHAKTLAMMRFAPDEQPIGIQLFGASPEVLARSAEQVMRDFNPDLIDLNCGCPVKKVVNKNGGA